jgi:hypothetical protein
LVAAKSANTKTIALTTDFDERYLKDGDLIVENLSMVILKFNNIDESGILPIMPIKLFFEKEKKYKNVKISVAKSGIINKVYKVEADNDIFYYKHADNEYLPNLKKNVSVDRLSNEKIAMEMASKISDKVPSIYYFNKEDKVMITTSIGSKTSLLKEELLDGNLNKDLIRWG